MSCIKLNTLLTDAMEEEAVWPGPHVLIYLLNTMFDKSPSLKTFR